MKTRISILVLGLIGAVLSGLVAAQESPTPPAAAAPAAPPTPCLDSERFREFDFWLGDWDVHTATGQFAGSNRIRSAENGCVVLEEWSGSQGGSGVSMNFYDAATDEWVQIWTGGGGSQIHIRGGLKDGAMQLVGKIHYVSNGNTADFRGTWTPLDDGRVRQFFEQSTDGGENWAPWFDGYYSRKAGEAGE